MNVPENPPINHPQDLEQDPNNPLNQLNPVAGNFLLKKVS